MFPQIAPPHRRPAELNAVQKMNASGDPSLQSLFSRKRKIRGFSLVEVVLALGVFSYAALSVVALLATGLSTTAGSRTSMAQANITRELRASLQATPFSSIASGTTYYFSYNGFPVTSATGAYYTATLTSGSSWYPADSLYRASSTQSSTNAYIVNVNLSYPGQTSVSATTSTLFVAQ